MSDEFFDDEEDVKSNNFDFLKIDLRIFYITLKRNIIYIILSSVVMFLIAAIIAKTQISSRWKATVILVRHQTESNPKTDMPYLYRKLDMNTILETIKVKENRLEIINRLKLNIPHDDLYQILEIGKGNKSNVISISAIYSTRDEAVNIANTSAEVFLDSYINLQNASIRKIYNYYLLEREKVLKNLDAIEKEEKEYLSEHRVISIENETSLWYKQLEGLEVSLVENKMLIEDLKTKIKEIKVKTATLPENMKISTTVSMEDQKTLKLLKKRLQEYNEKYTEENPNVIKIKEEIKLLEGKIKQSQNEEFIPDMVTFGKNTLKSSLETEQISYELEIKAAEKRLIELNDAITVLKEKLVNLSEIEANYLEIKRKKNLNTDLLKVIENRLQESKIVMESNINDFEIVERATSPKYPLSAHRKIIVIFGGFLGLFAAIFIIITIEFLDMSIKSKFDYEKVLNIPMIGELPEIQKNDSDFYSNIQIIFEEIQNITPHKKPVIISVGSDLQNSGKSYLIKSILKLLNKDKQVLYIDTIPSTKKSRKKKDIQVTKSNKEPESFKDYIINKHIFQNPEEAVIHQNISENIQKNYLVINKEIFKNIIDKKNFEDFISKLHNFDIIFWELFEPDLNIRLFSTLVELSDLLVMVFRFRKSKRIEAKKIINYLKNKNSTTVTGVLNYVDKRYFDKKYFLD